MSEFKSSLRCDTLLLSPNIRPMKGQQIPIRMSDMLKVSIEKDASTDIVRFDGPIDENCGEALNSLHGQVGNKVILNFRKLEYVNPIANTE